MMALAFIGAQSSNLLGRVINNLNMLRINYKKISALFISSFIFVVPAIIFAQSVPTIQNPLGSSNTDVTVLLQRIMDLVTKVGAVIVVFFVIYSGYKFVAARGNEGEVTKAKEMFYFTVIGAAILLGAGVIAKVVVGTVESTTGVKLQ